MDTKTLLTGLLLFAALPAPSQDTTGAGGLRGRVVRGDMRAAVAGAEVCVAAGRCQITNEAGEFRFLDLRPGEYRVSIGPVFTKVEVRAGVELDAEFSEPQIEQQRQTIDVTASVLLAPAEIKSSSYVLGGASIQSSPAAFKDVSRRFQTLPGVVFASSDFRNDLVVRGGSPLENLYIVDNIEIPNINHFANFASAGGPVGLFNAEMLSDVTFLSGGYPAPYNNRLSSVMQITQREGNSEKFSGQATAGFGGAGAVLEGPLGQEGSWIFSARRSFLDLFMDDIGFGGVPIYTNFQSKVVYDVNPAHRIWFSSLSGRDEIVIRPDSADPDQEADFYAVDSSGWRTAEGLNWQHLFGQKGVGLLGLTHSRGDLRSRVSDLRLSGSLVSLQDSSEDEIGAKYDVTLNLPVLDRLQAGASARWFLIDYRNLAPFGFENPFSPARGRVNPLDLNNDFVTQQQSAYVQSTRKLTNSVEFTGGLRWDRYAYLRASRVSPRAGLTWRLRPAMSVHGSFGIYAQQPFFVFLASDRSNRGLIPMRAEHTVAGFTWSPGNSFRLTLEAYQKRYRDYPVALEYPQITLASASDTYGPNYFLFPMTSAGRGVARGLEFFVEKKPTGRLFGQANFSWSRAHHSALDGILRRGAFDSPLLFNVTGGYRLARNWEMGLRYVYLTGRPYTPFDEIASRDQNRGVFDLRQVNGVRAPSYQRLDARIDRFFRFDRGLLNVYFGFQNVLDRGNFFGYQWNWRRNEPRTLTQMGRFPMIGMEWRFR